VAQVSFGVLAAPWCRFARQMRPWIMSGSREDAKVQRSFTKNTAKDMKK